MRLQNKVILSILMTFFLLTGAVYALSHTIFLDSFLQLEKSQVKKNIERINNAITTEINDLIVLTSDWAIWDDSYDFIVSGEQKYIDANIIDSVFTDSRLDFIIYINAAREVVYGRQYDLVNEQQTLLSDTLLSHLQTKSILLTPQETGEAIGGVIHIEKEKYLISSHPIIDSNEEKLPRGVLLMGRKVDKRLLDRLMSTIQVEIKLYDYDSLNTERNLIAQNIIETSKEKIVFENEETIAAYILLRDVFDIPSVLIEARSNRDIYQQGIQATTYVVAILVTSALVIAGILIFLIQKIVTAKVEDLDNSVHQIELTKDVSTRIENKFSDDEIGHLARRINSMLESIQISQYQLESARLGADQANLAKTEFLTSMSHELRTPLNAILGYSQLLDLRAKNLVDDEKEWVSEIIVAGKYLLNLINELLELSSIESGILEIDVEPVMINKIIERAVHMVIPVADKSDVELVLEIDELKSLRIMADEIKLQQILINLLTNAVKYNKSHGRINLSGAIIGKYCYINIEDNGIGISKEKLEDVFKPFQRGDAYKSGVDGVGIGLSITRRLVEAMNGRVEVKSKLNVGSIFTLVLPIN